jgi:hypothetical protein
VGDPMGSANSSVAIQSGKTFASWDCMSLASESHAACMHLRALG